MKKHGRGFIWADEEIGYLKSNYSTKSKEDLIKYFNKSWNAITKKASKLKLKRDITKQIYNRGWTNEEEQYLTDNYEFGDLNKISKKLNRTRKAIAERAKLLKLRRDSEIVREQCKKYAVNEGFFKIWSKNMSYILGLICADGNVTQRCDGNRLSICLHKDDSYLIEDIYKAMSSSHRVYYSKNIAKLNIENKVLYNDLLKLGITPAKSKTIGKVNVPEEYISDFIRGVLDGDGSVDSKRKRAKIVTASNDFAKCLSGMLDKINVEHKLYNEGYIYNKEKTDFYVIKILKRVAVKRLYNLMYKNAKLFLTRKKKAFVDMGVLEEDFEVKCKSRFRKVIAENIESDEIIVFKSLKEAEKNGFARTHIHSVIKGKYRQYRGYIWRYYDK